MSTTAGNRAKRPAQAASGATVVRSDGAPPRVLLAEDSMAARVLTAALLRRMGCKVDTAEHGEEAVSHVQAADYDVVLMDIEMPVMDGFLAAKEIRSLGGAAAKTPIVALSAFVADTQKCSSWRKSFNLSLTKPAGREQLRGVLQAMLRKDDDNEHLQKLQGPSSRLRLSLVNSDELSALTDPMPRAEAALLLDAARADLVRNGDLLRIALADEDLSGARKVAHKIRGIAASFAAARAAELARRFEETTERRSAKVVADLGQQLADCVAQTADLLAKTVRVQD